jgi:hypothetical protein
MKKLTILVLFISACSMTYAQNTAKDVFTKDEIVWYGLDFSKAKMIGKFDQGAGAAPASGTEIKNKYFSSWNEVVVTETKKYDFKKAFRKTSVYKDLSVVEKSNAKVDADELMTYNDYKFQTPDATVDGIIKSYGKGEKSEGIGLVFIVESFNKGEQYASVYVTFFDIATKTVLFKERMQGKAGGFGIRNYWAKAVYSILTEIDDSAYKSWKKTYGS